MADGAAGRPSLRAPQRGPAGPGHLPSGRLHLCQQSCPLDDHPLSSVETNRAAPWAYASLRGSNTVRVGSSLAAVAHKEVSGSVCISDQIRIFSARAPWPTHSPLFILPARSPSLLFTPPGGGTTTAWGIRTHSACLDEFPYKLNCLQPISRQRRGGQLRRHLATTAWARAVVARAVGRFATIARARAVVARTVVAHTVGGFATTA